MNALVQNLEQLLYRCITKFIMQPTKMKHTSAVEGLENLPLEGAYILVPNHASYMDHFLLMALFRFCFGTKLLFLTKQEAFQSWYSRMWHNCLGGIPVNREKTDLKSMKAVIANIRQGKVVVIYPEGTRGHGRSLLPFKPGAFKIAEMTGVPVIPVGIRGANKILPKGGRIFRKASAQLIFGKPISAQMIKQMGAEQAAESCRATISEMVYGSVSLTPEKVTRASGLLARKAESIIEQVLEDGLAVSSRAQLNKALSVAEYAKATDAGNVNAQIQYARAYGLSLLAKSRWSFICNAGKIKTAARQITQCDSNHPFAHYIMGVYNITIPALLGGSVYKASEFLAHAYTVADAYGIAPRNFALTYAKALIACGKHDEARSVLFTLTTVIAVGKREERRIQQATALMAIVA